MFVAAMICLAVFASVATIDGIYFHLIRCRLFALPDSRYEHRLHTIHAIFFPILVLALFLREVSGVFLLATVVLVSIDFGVEILDVLCERASRASLGGLSTAEYLVHVLAITSRVAAFTLALASRPAAAWALPASAIHGMPMPALARATCWAIAAGGVGMAALHLWLLRPAEASEAGPIEVR